ncbi:hypothetical protein [Niveispirillum cyanobacteriorum]|uniref:Uncharacterized protein n=1 Tax=Niveispirillum cyanobacteriorum TaxID=1612173 RepID=A0A2K9N9K4_9PROT|nr:hypothetical protein [Niveispirillum cyanobacteriorum]AUN29236.1 hypothetical protein C0V82_02460 [Niveispirillum cyanobacteriorum]GGE66162.1 hypothetical protein GCM10011317_24330 [Niveispirillum cyanobacteriorum]
MPSLSHNPYDTDHPTLTAQEQAEAWWRGSSDRHVRPFREDVSFASCGHLLEGYKSRKADEVTWAKIAFHLAAGVPIIKIAEHYKLSRTTIWRALTQSHNLRRRVAEERALMRREADSRFVAMRELVVDTLYRAIADGNMRATLWAADRLGLGAELLQQAEKPPKPGYARIPDGWMTALDPEAAIRADLSAPRGREVPLPVPESSTPAAPPPTARRRGPILPAGAITASAPPLLPDPGPEPFNPDLAGTLPDPPPDLTPETSPDVGLAPDPVPTLPPIDADPMGQSGDPLPDFPKELRWRNRPRGKVKASAPPTPHHDGPSLRLKRGCYRLRARPAVRLLFWILHNSLPLADGVDGAPGLSAARWTMRARWLAWGDKLPMDLCNRDERPVHNVSQPRWSKKEEGY